MVSNDDPARWPLETYQVCYSVSTLPCANVSAVLGTCQHTAEQLNHHSQTKALVTTWEKVIPQINSYTVYLDSL